MFVVNIFLLDIVRRREKIEMNRGKFFELSFLS